MNLLEALDEELSYKILGSEFSKAAKGYYNSNGDFIKWDGRRHLLQPDGKFSAGLYLKVLDFLSREGIVPDIEDARHEPPPATPIDILPRLKEMEMVPRPYQMDAANIAIQHDRGIIKIATGGGKTAVMALIAAKLGRNTLILVIGTDLLYQTYKFFEDVFQKEIGIIGDGNCIVKDITVASIWTLGRVLGTKDAVLSDDEDDEKALAKEKYHTVKQLLQNSSTIIFDECQLVGCQTTLEISKHLGRNLCNLYGMSASPRRDDGADLLIESVLGKRIVDISARFLIDNGFLVEPIIRFLAVPPYPQKRGKYPNVYSKYIIENQQRNEMGIKAAIKMIEQGFRPFILFKSLKHGEILYNMIKDKVPSVLLSGNDPSHVREQAKQDFKDGKILCIVASKIFSTGIDLRNASGLVNMASGKASVENLQKIGRVIRKHPGKKIAAIIEFSDQAPYLFNHSVKRKEIYETEFKVQWPGMIASRKVDEEPDPETKD